MNKEEQYQKQLEILEDKNQLLQHQNNLLESQLTNTENTLSDTIAFFSVTFGLIGLGATVLLILTGWIMNKLFNDKLKTVKEKSDEVILAKKEIDSFLKNAENIHDKNTKLNKTFQEHIDKYKNIHELHNYLQNENEVNQVYILILRELQSIFHMETFIERNIPKITNEMIENSKWKTEDGEVQSSFKYKFDYYKEDLDNVFNLMNKKIDIFDYMDEKESGDKPKDNSFYNEILGFKQGIEDFYEIVKELVNENENEVIVKRRRIKK